MRKLLRPIIKTTFSILLVSVLLAPKRACAQGPISPLLDEAQTILDSANTMIRHGDFRMAASMLDANRARFQPYVYYAPTLKPRYHQVQGKVYTLALLYELALPEYELALKGFMSLKDYRKTVETIIQIAEFYRKNSDYEKSKEYMLLAEQMFQSHSGLEFEEAMYYNRRAAVYTEEGYVDSAIAYSNLAIDLASKTDNFLVLGLSHNELGYLYYHLEKVKLADQHYNRSKFYLRKEERWRLLCNVYYNHSRLEIHNKDYRKASLQLDSCYQLLMGKNWPSMELSYLERKEWLARINGNKQLEQSVRMERLEKEIALEKQMGSEKVREVELLYDQRLNEDIIQQQKEQLYYEMSINSEKEKERNLFAVAAVVVSVLLVIILIAALNISSTSKRLTRQKESLDNANEELNELLRLNTVYMQEIHHRVKNNLAVISGLIELQLNRTTDESLKKGLFDTMSRIRSMGMAHQLIYADDQAQVLNASEFLKEVAELSRSHLPGDLKMDLKIDCEHIQLNLVTSTSLGILVNELMTNACKHAIPAEGPLKIDISLQKVGNELRLDFRDNGPGLPSGYDIQKSKSLGFLLIEKMVKQLKGEFLFKSENGLIFTSRLGYRID